ncbi:DNA/RNA non-specific endonuclease [Diaphorobacter sp. HDW4B]|uniref:DNA/RNA non-specific endonuclease n=1 Tax=Diaphorobacter sp. HDW4B TaxID=2714925 RepID=UPI001407C3FE|nr:DNA/RNA non-specific endonuclease [Diaphorobacter sp. HDW4B]QIL72632.1 DNA/RNA non-specific endonuclease [Diaphorobacter sp. HDW4B]
MTVKNKKKKPTKRKAAGSSISSLVSSTRRLCLWLIGSSAIATQISSCGLMPWVLEELRHSSLNPPFRLPPIASTGPSTGHAPPASPVSSSNGQGLSPTRFVSCPEFFAGGIAPRVPSAPKLRELCYHAFAVLHNGSTRTPVFVAERLNRQTVLNAQGEERTDRFFADARLPRSERSELDDYKGSGFARGHMAPAADMPTPEAMAQSFSLANMVPQNSAHNSGPWAKIEKDTRSYALRAKGDVYVITGPVYESPRRQTIGQDRVSVPTQLFKLVYDATTKRAWAHWQQNSAQGQAGRPISYGELEQRLGMELLPGVEIR